MGYIISKYLHLGFDAGIDMGILAHVSVDFGIDVDAHVETNCKISCLRERSTGLPAVELFSAVSLSLLLPDGFKNYNFFSSPFIDRFPHIRRGL